MSESVYVCVCMLSLVRFVVQAAVDVRWFREEVEDGLSEVQRVTAGPHFHSAFVLLDDLLRLVREVGPRAARRLDIVVGRFACHSAVHWRHNPWPCGHLGFVVLCGLGLRSV